MHVMTRLPSPSSALIYDIFCRVIDNYGDAGVCWRLASQLAQTYGGTVRLIIDRPEVLAPLLGLPPWTTPLVEIGGVSVYDWGYWKAKSPPVGDCVIEAFACELPASTQNALCQKKPPARWINLEYLSAESWVEGCHLLPSRHPLLGLQKTFFFPGFSKKTGGLLREPDLLEVREAFCAHAPSQQAFWQRLNLSPPDDQTLTISLFAYGHPALQIWLTCLMESAQTVRLCVPVGRMLEAVCGALETNLSPGQTLQRGALHVCALPFLSQKDYDKLLWLCDFNAVRGEDSWVRALWAGKPLLWQIYPQEDFAHIPKLQAFLTHYAADLPSAAREAIENWHFAWNNASEQTFLAEAWGRLVPLQAIWTEHAKMWANRVSKQTDLAQNLVFFCQGDVK